MIVLFRRAAARLGGRAPDEVAGPCLGVLVTDRVETLLDRLAQCLLLIAAPLGQAFIVEDLLRDQQLQPVGSTNCTYAGDCAIVFLPIGIA